jgi:hypothetical protein
MLLCLLWLSDCSYFRSSLQEIEGTLHCILSIQEAIPVEKAVSGIRGVETTHAQYGTIFGSDVLGRLPTTGHERVRLTMVNLLGNSSCFPEFMTAHRSSQGNTLLSLPFFQSVQPDRRRQDHLFS